MLSRFGQFSSIMFSIQRDIQKIEREEMIKHGYKGAYAQYLVALYQHPEGLISSRVSEICDKDKAAVSRILSEMQEYGLVVREKNGENRYRGIVKLTEEGMRVARSVCDSARVAVAAVGQEMTDEERTLFYDTLERISAKLQAMARDGIPTEFE